MSAEPGCVVERLNGREACFVRLSGSIDGALDLAAVGAFDRPTTLDLSGVVSITSQGVGRFTSLMSTLPFGMPAYLFGCPPCIVDQLNLVQNFAGAAEVLSVRACFSCACGLEEERLVDVLADGARIRSGRIPLPACSRCDALMRVVEDDSFQFVAHKGARRLDPHSKKMLAQLGVYDEVAPEQRPLSLRKVVDGDNVVIRMEGCFVESTRLARRVDDEGIVAIALRRLVVRAEGQTAFSRFIARIAATARELVLCEVPPQLARWLATEHELTTKLKLESLLVPIRCTTCTELSLGKMTLIGDAPAPRCPRCGKVASWTSVPADVPKLRAGGIPSANAIALVERADALFSESAIEAKLAAQGNRPHPDELPLQIGGYKILRPLSAGGMAEVLLATRTSLGGVEKPVALKRFRRELFHSAPTSIAMFLAEARLAAQLNHPNVVQIFDVGESDGDLYIAMELIDGKDLRELLDLGRPAPPHLVAHIGLELARALAYLHHAKDLRGRPMQIVHRDVSPQNVLVDRSGRVVLIDFGVALAGEGELQKRRRAVAGNLAYMSPEQCYGEPLDGRSDLFSLGVVMWELLAGMPLFRRPNANATRAALLAGEVPPLPHVPEPLHSLVRQLLHPDLTGRPTSAQDVAHALDAMMPQLGDRIAPTEVGAFIEAALKPSSLPTPPMAPAPPAPAHPSRRFVYLTAAITALSLAAYFFLR